MNGKPRRYHTLEHHTTEKRADAVNDNTPHIASVGSPSSNYDLTLDLTLDARNHPLVGSMLTVENAMGDGAELALGTVTEVTTTNKWHEDPAFRGALAGGGEIPGMSGDEGDSRRARIRVQAAWRRANPDCPWEPSGSKVICTSPKLIAAYHVLHRL